jgi:hypothetical protein
VDTKELEALDLLHYSPFGENWCVLDLPCPVVHNQILWLDQVEGVVVRFVTSSI